MVAWRLVGLGLVCLGLLLRYGWRRVFGRGRDLGRMRAEWVQEGGEVLCRYLGIELTDRGKGARWPEGLVVCNHISYVDIPVIAAHFPCGFVSKAEVRSWPVFGWLAVAGGSLFLKRESRTATRQVAEAMRERLGRGDRLVVFPEGTSSNGEEVLPFRTALFAAAIEAGVPVVPAALTYEIAEGTGAEGVAYWGEMTLFPHLCRLMRMRGIKARFVWGEPLVPGLDRKTLAVVARERVAELKRGAELAGTGAVLS